MSQSVVAEAALQPGLAKSGILHIGIGAFHRAHQAVYTEKAMAAKGGNWHIIGVSLRSTDIVDVMNQQDCTYTVLERHPEGPCAHRITSISHVIAAARDVKPVLAALSDSAIRIVTITVTEKAYGIDRHSGKIQYDHPAIQHDLEHPDKPSGLVGILVAGLKSRMNAAMQPFTVVSCDNLPANGRLLRSGVVDFANQIDPQLADWISEKVSFPSTMVDRITPASTSSTFADVKALTGQDDRAAIETEPFSQWVIEDNFPDGRPAWEDAGAIVVNDVEPYEGMKLRMLNGSHSLIAYLGLLGGYRYVRDVMANDNFARLVARHMDNAAATMPPLDGIDFSDYGAELIERFRNPEIAHEARQIAMDGTEKLPQRIFAPACDLHDDSGHIGTYALCFAAWLACMHKQVAVNNTDNTHQLPDDPRAVEIAERINADQDAAALYDQLASLSGWMPPQLYDNRVWRSAVIERLSMLMSQGADATITQEMSK